MCGELDKMSAKTRDGPGRFRPSPFPKNKPSKITLTSSKSSSKRIVNDSGGIVKGYLPAILPIAVECHRSSCNLLLYQMLGVIEAFALETGVRLRGQSRPLAPDYDLRRSLSTSALLCWIFVSDPSKLGSRLSASMPSEDANFSRGY